LLKKIITIRQKIFIITGKIGSGKTTFLTELVKRMQEQGLSVSGFLAIRSRVKGSVQSYGIRFPDSKETIPLSSREYVKEWLKTGNFYFNPEALKRGNDMLSDSQILNKDLIVVDEIGIFELEGKIWADAVSRLIKNGAGIMIWVVRSTLVEKVIRRWGLKDTVIIDIDEVSLKEAEKMILSRF
jgi:nucleoside-triphosphatase THEP1